MTEYQRYLLIPILSIGCMLTRYVVFLAFADRETPSWMRYLADMLPCAIIGFLIIYCLKSVSLITHPYGIPEAIAVLVVVGLHWWKENTLLSIACGTALYMLLVHLF